MSADPTTAPRPAPATDPEAALRELAARYPEPDWREWAANREWLAEQEASGALNVYSGKVVAAYNKQLVGIGDDYVALLIGLSRQYDVHPGRIAVTGIDW